MLSKQQYHALKAQGYTHIPLIKKHLMDDKTPVSVFASIRDLDSCAYLFESVEGGERFARYSMIGLGGTQIFSYADGLLTQSNGGVITQTATKQPLEQLQAFMRRFHVPTQAILPELPLFSGGLVGYFGYDLVRCIEPSLGQGDKPNPMGLPDLWLMLSSAVVVFDNLAHVLSLVVYAETSAIDSYERASALLERMEQALHRPVDLTVAACPVPVFVSQTGKAQFCQDVETIKDYILQGDVMQVVPAQRLSADFDGDPLALYRALRYLNPSPYLFLLVGKMIADKSAARSAQNTHHFHVVGASPEILARIEAGKVTVRPLAGTRRRGKTPAEDIALEQELLSDAKEIAEHLMLIDLGRNDIGKVCIAGSVQVTEKMFVERYSQVMHIASNVEGEIKDGIDTLDVFAATFPAGTLSGAPKVRAMQIIDELEPLRRTVFGGAVGYLGWHGNIDTAIAIRTAVLKDGKMHVQAGAGVVADSDPLAEWEETNNKARAIIQAAELACRGLEID